MSTQSQPQSQLQLPELDPSWVKPFEVQRRHDWAIRFTEFMKDSLDLREDLVLDWENQTCLSWACMGIEEMTGENPFEPFKEFQSSIALACRSLKKVGVNTLDDFVVALFGHGEISTAFLQRGDLVLIPSVADWAAGEPSAHAIMPHAIALADPPLFWTVMPEGLAKGSIHVATRAFAVGRIPDEAALIPRKGWF